MVLFIVLGDGGCLRRLFWYQKVSNGIQILLCMLVVIENVHSRTCVKVLGIIPTINQIVL
jgi:hypothetical protein